MNIIEAIQHPAIFGALPAFKDLRTWKPWLVFLKALYGLPMDQDEEVLFLKHTGRSVYNPPDGGWPEAVCITGRQSGKSRIAGLIADFEAVTARPEADRTETFALLLAQDQRSAIRALFGYTKAPFEAVDALRAEVLGTTAEMIKLANGVNIAAYPCRPASIRGLRARVVICDELGFYVSTENLPTDKEMLRAVRPTLATTGGKLIVLSSPYGQSGELWELYRKHYGNDDSTTLIWQASASQMNPTLPADYLQRMEQDDPEAYRSEVLGEFRSGVATFLDPALIAEAVDTGIHERPYESEIIYSAHTDAASGTAKDRFTLAIAHNQDGKAILDLVRAWFPPFNPSGVIAEIADILKRYNIYEARGDKWSPGFVAEHFRTHGITYTYADLDRSGIYLEFMPVLNSGMARLLDAPEMLRELRGLERRRGTSGRDRVDHRPGQHDDLAVSAAGAIVAASRVNTGPGIYVFD